MVSKNAMFMSLVLTALMISFALAPAVGTASENAVGSAPYGDGASSNSVPAYGALSSEGPTADFSVDVTYGIGSLTVSFIDRSTNAASWMWNFGDGSTSPQQNPIHTYAAVGKYTVTLTVTNSTGSDTETKADLITVYSATQGVYSTSGANANPGAPDVGIPGYVGPDGDGVVSEQNLDNPTPGENYINPIFVEWASVVIDYSPANQYIYSNGFSSPSNVLGPATGNNFGIASLGDLTTAQILTGEAPGSITVGFDVPIANGPGPDFAAFENAFISAGGAGVAGQTFAELGYVEVSTDGITFVRFPSVSLTPSMVGGYGSIDPTNVYNLVGKHCNAYGTSWGTPFDLSDLLQTPEVLSGSVDVNNINFVRVVDIPGNGYFLDSLGNPIYDAWLTVGSGGLDLEAIGVINTAYPVAGFTTDKTSGIGEVTVQFTDKSAGSPIYWQWDFGDGTTSTERNPSHVYSAPGIYTVTLTVADLAGSDTRIRFAYIEVTEA